jgi:AraC family transcriptional regulator
MPFGEPMNVTVERAFGTSRVEVELRSYEFTGPFESLHQAADRCFFDFSLTPRPGHARGRYEALWGPARSEAIGDILFVPAGLAMLGSCQASFQQSLACFIDPALFALEIGRLEDGALAETLHIGSPVVRRGLIRILRETSRPSLASPLAIEASAMLLAVDVARHLQGHHGPSDKKTGGLSPTQMRILEDRIRAPLPLPTVAELARACGLSQRHLARAFQQETGRTLGEHVNAAGVERAWGLLVDSDLSIKQIAGSLGFSRSSSFSFAFRRATGQRPRDVRRAARPYR